MGDGKSLTTAHEELCECGFVRAYDIVLFEVKSEGLFLAWHKRETPPPSPILIVKGAM